MNRRGIFRLADMIGDESTNASIDGNTWYRAVPAPFYYGLSRRMRAAWAVLKGEAYAIEWPETGDLERAIRRATPTTEGGEA